MNRMSVQSGSGSQTVIGLIPKVDNRIHPEDNSRDAVLLADMSLAPNLRDFDVPPDGGYGWIVTACGLLINAHTWGVNSVHEYSRPVRAWY